MQWKWLRVEMEAKEGKKKIEQSFTILLLVGNDYMQQANSMSEPSEVHVEGVSQFRA